MAPKKKGQRMALDDFLMDDTFSGSGSGSWADEDMPLPTASTDGWGGGGLGLGSGPSLTAGPPLGAGGFSMNMTVPIPTVPPFTARINNLSFDATEQTLREFLLERNLKLESVRVLKDSETGRARGSAFVDFADRDSLQRSLNLRDPMLQGRAIHVAVAEQRGGRDPSDGNWRGARRDLGAGPEPELDWAAARRTGPPLQSPASAMDRPGLERFRRSGPPPSRFDEPEEDFDWSARRSLPGGPTPRAGGFGTGPRRPREPDFEPDWSARRTPVVEPRRPPRFGHGSRHHDDPTDKAFEEFGRRRHGNAQSRSQGAPQQTAAATTPAAPPKDAPTAASKLQRGFEVLTVDDDEDETKQAEDDTKPAVVPESVAELQKAERAKEDDGTWTQA